MANRGFITNLTVQAGITTAYNQSQAILLELGTAADAKSLSALPAGARWSHLRVGADETAGTCTKLEAALFWDSSCNEIAAGPSQSAYSVFSLGADTTLRQVVIPIDIEQMAPAGQTTAGKAYLLLKTDAGTVTCPVGGAELHWVLPSVQG